MSLRKVTPDWPLVLTALALSVFGMLMVYSAGQTELPSYVSRVWKHQLVWFFISLLGAWAIVHASIRMLEWLTWPLYAFSILLLVVTLIIGTGAGTAASTKSWLTVGGVRLGQPAELAKLTVVLMLAKVLVSNREAPKTLVELWKPALVVGVPWLLIMAQPDLGTGIVFIGILFGMLFWFGIPWPLLILVASPAVSLILAFSTTVWGAWFLLLVALVIWYRPFLAEGVFLVVSNVAMGVLAPLLWERLQPYQQKRLLVFLDPTMDPRQSGYHVM
jgi:rod shape determining protein RodA